MSSIIKPIILCGGDGTRLWPLSRKSYPKQFLPLIGEKSLFELTLKRVEKFGSPICIANEEHRFFVKDLLNNFLINNQESSANIFLEPSPRNTAVAMGVTPFIPDIAPTDLLLFLPSDHYIPDSDLFSSIIESGISAARAGYIVTFGVQPSFPSTAYGYIRHGSCLESLSNGVALTFSVENFVEKPQLENAQNMLLSGSYLWNAGIFLCQASTLLEGLSKHAFDIYEGCHAAMQRIQLDGSFMRPSKDAFLACRAESIDYAVMEHFDKVAVVPFSGSWSDVGSWNAVANLTPTDTFGNRINGKGLAIQSSNTYINSPHRTVVGFGVSDLVIVDTVDAVLVASSDKVEEVKEVVAELKIKNCAEAVYHRRVIRPWGWYDSIDMGDCFQVKRIAVKPGASLSLQMHRHRAEHWIVVKGTAKVTNGEQVFLLEENQSTYISIGVKHRLENPGSTDLEIIEVQSGTYLGEDDIVRFEDNYGRVKT